MERKKRTGNKKYNEVTIQKICDSLKENGSRELAYLAGNIHQGTFYNWKDKHPEFAKRTEEAEAYWRKNVSSETYNKAIGALDLYLSGNAVQTWEKTTEERDTQGKLISSKKTTHRSKKGVPRWTIERILGADFDIVTQARDLAFKGMIDVSVVEEILSELGTFKEKVRAILSRGIEQKSEQSAK